MLEKKQIDNFQDERGILVWTSQRALGFAYEAVRAGSIGPHAQRGNHYHKKTREIFVCLGGKIRYRGDDQEIVLEPGEYVDIPVNVVHSFINDCEDTAFFLEFRSKEHDESDVFRPE